MIDKYVLNEWKDKLKDMVRMDQARDWINRNSAVVTVASVAVLVVSLAVIISQRPNTGAPPPGDAYYYDVVAKTYFTDKATKIAPIQSATGGESVRAHFFTCGECTDALESEGGQRFLGYYEKYALDVKEKIESNPQSMHFYEEVFRGRFYCPPDKDPTDEKNWVAAETPDGFEIAQNLQNRCPARKLRYCPPTK